MTPPSVDNPLFPAEESRLVEIWTRMQRLQTDFCIHQEAAFYYTQPRWRAARRVLDVGTGTGYYLHQIANLFPDKSYTGIDSSGPLVAEARLEFRGLDVALLEADFETYEAEAPFDFVLMRLLLQHLKGVGEALDRAARLVAPGGSLLVIDALDAARFFEPPESGISELFEAYTRAQKARGRDRDVGDRVVEAVRSQSAWELAARVPLVIPATIPGNRELFDENYGLFIDLVELAGDLTLDFAPIRKQWSEWRALERSYMQVGLDFILLRRVGG